ncbi:hypothetical protein [Erwinia aphidicola]|uniref:Uncharacterized protein n=1 Tax=Erwinia aphidicola TaxID=68334 RepID=A0ABU8DMY9_ERWAP
MKTHDAFEKDEAAHPEPEPTGARSGMTVSRTNLNSNVTSMDKRARDDWQELAASLKHES